ncbi:MAG: carboxypeptidase-like regulatory domain-containing protein [Terriglobales bacterium]
MKARSTRIVLVLSCVLSLHLNAGATTCVSNKKFKIKQVCGRVTDPSNVPIPMVNVELLDTHSVVVQQAPTDEDGIFTFQNVAKG